MTTHESGLNQNKKKIKNQIPCDFCCSDCYGKKKKLLLFHC